MTAPRHRPPDITGPTWRWLLEVTLGAEVWRFTDAPGGLALTSDAGDAVAYLPGLTTPEVEIALDHLSADPVTRNASIDVLWPGDLPQEIERGHVPEYAPATLSQYWSGTDDKRVILLSGVLRGVTYGAAEEPLRASLEEQEWDDQGALVDAAAVASATTTWASASGGDGFDPAVEGAVYPTIIGKPGGLARLGAGPGVTIASDGSPGLLVDNNPGAAPNPESTVILVAGHQVVGGSVGIYNHTSGDLPSHTEAIQHKQDDYGRVIAYVDGGNATTNPTLGDELWIGWGDSSGGLRNPYGSGALRGAGDVLRWALDRSTLRTDRSRMAALAELNQYSIDAYVNDMETTPSDWIRANLAPILPVSPVLGPAGHYYALWRPDAVAADAQVVLEAGRNCERLSRVTWVEPSDPASEILFEYAFRWARDQYRRYRRISTRRDPADPWDFESVWAHRSPYSGRLTVKSKVIYDDYTAGLIAAHLLRRHGFPWREVTYSLSAPLGWLLPGDVVALTDAEESWTLRPAEILRVLYTAAGAVEADIGLYQQAAGVTA